MKNAVAMLFLIALLGIGAGCNKDDASNNKAAAGNQPVSVINFDKIFKQMGWSDEINKDMKQADVQLGEQYQTITHAIEDAYTQQKRAIVKSANVTAEKADAMMAAKDRAELEKLGMNSTQLDQLMAAGMGMQREKVELGQKLGQSRALFQQNVIVNYRQSLDPALRRVALANNRSIVMDHSQLAWFDPSAEITDKVVDELGKTPPAKPAIPELQRVIWHPTPATGSSAPTTIPTLK
ncbi:MAG TPA: OmpH family outer membrane protein [Tepidisphaeraceae bacterium]|nr:OmpH family outer membrane protein [Tepidisphaeraceae bacterium]